jgi:very-short-patch-repair endonuclease
MEEAMSSDTYRGELRRVTLGPEVRALRAQTTPAEQRLWEVVRARRLAGWKFRRQHQHGPFVLDFYCLAARLAVEADGASHASPRAATAIVLWTAYLASHGVRVLRFANDQIIHQLDECARRSWPPLASPLSSLPPMSAVPRLSPPLP